MNKDHLYFEFIKHHTPSFGKNAVDEWVFCGDMICSKCKIDKQCGGNYTGDIFYLSEDAVIKFKEKHPEYFI